MTRTDSSGRRRLTFKHKSATEVKAGWYGLTVFVSVASAAATATGGVEVMAV